MLLILLFFKQDERREKLETFALTIFNNADNEDRAVRYGMNMTCVCEGISDVCVFLHIRDLGVSAAKNV